MAYSGRRGRAVARDWPVGTLHVWRYSV